jgi:uncharacterized protein YyaL (SSP411 family)
MKKYITVFLSSIFIFQSATLGYAEQNPLSHLAHEKSPYLLQHVDNLVDWYPWSDKAFEKAKAENKPVFLSIGYSTCHWCHVMEEESFKNPVISALINKNFVAIKVDREERPDIDEVYMNAVQMMTGSGGWPLNVFLTPDRKPIFGGSYFPPIDRPGMVAFPTILEGIARQWEKEKDQIIVYSEKFMKNVIAKTKIKTSEQVVLTKEVLDDAYFQLAASYDADWGGFGAAPKFPRSHNLRFLLRYWKRTGKENAIKMIDKTLNEISLGGIYDHIGGGVHRYTTDADWFLPHFEKMLYDQALLSLTYIEAYQTTANKDYAWVAQDILSYVGRELTSPEGAFYSAQDADNLVAEQAAGVHKEGAFYLWQWQDLKEILSEDEFKIFTETYTIEEDGNIEVDPLKEFENLNVVFLNEKAEARSQMSAELKSIRQKVFEARNKRPHPSLDDKILTDWNGLMISSLSVASSVLENDQYLEQAKKAADFILKTMIREKDGRLMHRYRDAEVKITGFLTDYAFFIGGLLDLYEASFEVKYLEKAEILTQDMITLFWDTKRGGFFNTSSDAEVLLLRPKDIYDGSIPSGNALASLVLMRLGRILQISGLEERAYQNVNVFAPLILGGPHRYTQMLLAIDFAVGPSYEVVLAGESRAAIKPLEEVVYKHFLPNKVVIYRPRDENDGIFAKVPFLKNQKEKADLATAYICHHYQCDFPTNDLQTLADQLSKEQI